MQTPTAPPRDGLTDTQVIELIRDDPGLIVSAGCELLDQGLNVIEDISSDLIDGSVSRSNYATLHGSATLDLSRDLNWGRAILRPYMTLSNGALSARFNLGAYYTSTPERNVGTKPELYQVTGFDLIHALNTPVGDAFAVTTGSTYLSAVETILINLGFTRYLIDPSRAATTLVSDMVWPLSEQITWLTVVNDLLGAVGYRGIWSDWDGQLRCEQYNSPSERSSEWTYDTGQYTSMLGPVRRVVHDFFDAPNRWVAVRTNNVDGSPPVEGDGIYTYVNQYNGETSIEGRGGRVITRLVSVEAADQAALISRAQSTIDSDVQVRTTVTASSSPNPLHWHFDRITLDDPDIGAVLEMQQTNWTLPLNGSDMGHEWSVI